VAKIRRRGYNRCTSSSKATRVVKRRSAFFQAMRKRIKADEIQQEINYSTRGLEPLTLACSPLPNLGPHVREASYLRPHILKASYT
jgi:hypothetical protein